MSTYNTPGHVCPETRRIALSLRDFFGLPVAVPGFFYSVRHAESGQNPWHPLDGIRMHTEDAGADVSFHGGIEPIVLTAEQFAHHYVYVSADAPVPMLEEIAALATAPGRRG